MKRVVSMKFVWTAFVLGSIFFHFPAYSISIILKVSLAESWFNIVEKYTPKEKQEFILGALIWNISFLDSNETSEYEKGITLTEVYEEKNPFEAGLKFHSYLAEKKCNLIEKWGVFRLVTGIPSDQINLFFKLLEDETLYNRKISSKASSCLSSIVIGELLTGIEVEKLAIWHGILYKYLAAKPSETLITLKKDKRVKMPVSEDTLEIWKAALMYFSKNEKIKSYMSDLIGEFETSFEFFKLKYMQNKSST